MLYDSVVLDSWMYSDSNIFLMLLVV